MLQKCGDFGQTLFVWGFAEGPYVMRPYLGPSTVRDTAGWIVDMFIDPVGLATGSQVAFSVATSGLDAVEKLGQWKQAEDASMDIYSVMRSSWYQMRRAPLREALGLPDVVDSPALDDPEAPKEMPKETPRQAPKEMPRQAPPKSDSAPSAQSKPATTAQSSRATT